MWFLNANCILNDIQLTQELHIVYVQELMCANFSAHVHIHISFFMQATVWRYVNMTSLLVRNQRLRYPLVIWHSYGKPSFSIGSHQCKSSRNYNYSSYFHIFSIAMLDQMLGPFQSWVHVQFTQFDDPEPLLSRPWANAARELNGFSAWHSQVLFECYGPIGPLSLSCAK